jgi:hypothetical protein
MRSKNIVSNTGKLVVGILILFFAVTLVVNSQEKMTLKLPDTSANWQRTVFSDSLFPTFSFLPPRPLGLLCKLPEFPSQPNFWTMPDKIDLIAPWKLQLAKQEKYSTMRMILGSVGFGGAAYIAYQHVKKYGLK